MLNLRFAGLTTMALCFTTMAASAQRVTDIENGVRVRITNFQGDKFVGSLIAANPDSVTLSTGRASGVHSTASANVAAIEVSTGRHRGQGALIKGMLGLGIGALTGAIVGAVSYSEPDPKKCSQNSDPFGFGCALANGCFFVCSEGQSAALGGILGGASGLLVGTIVGIATGHETWTAIEFR